MCSGVNPLKSEMHLLNAISAAKEISPFYNVQPVNAGKTTVAVFSDKCTRRIVMVCGKMQSVHVQADWAYSCGNL